MSSPEQIASLRAQLDQYAVLLAQRTDELETAAAAKEEAEAEAASFRAEARKAQDALRRAEEQRGGEHSRLEERMDAAQAALGPLKEQLREARALHEQERAEWSDKEATLRHKAKNANQYLEALRDTRTELAETKKRLEKASVEREELDKLRRRVRGQAARIKQLKASGATEPDPLENKLVPPGYRMKAPAVEAEQKAVAQLNVSATRLVDVLPDGAEVEVLGKRCAAAERQLAETRERLVLAEDTGGKERARKLARAARGVLDSLKPSAGLETEMRDGEGLVVTHVRRAGSAERSGVVRGMTVLRVAGEAVENAGAVARAVARMLPGEEIELVVADPEEEQDPAETNGVPAAAAAAAAEPGHAPSPPGGAAGERGGCGAGNEGGDDDEEDDLGYGQNLADEGEADSFLVDVESPNHRAVTLVVGAAGVDLKTVQRLAAIAGGVLAADEGEEAFVESVVARRLAKASTAEEAARQASEARARAASAIPPEVVDALREQVSQVKDAAAREAKLLREAVAAREEELAHVREAADEDAAARQAEVDAARAAAGAAVEGAREQAVADTAAFKAEAEERAAEAEKERTLREVLRREKDRLEEELAEARARVAELEPLVPRLEESEARVAELTKTEAGLAAAIQRVAELEAELESHRKRVREQRRLIEEQEREADERAAAERKAEEERAAEEQRQAAEQRERDEQDRAAAVKRRMSLKALQLLGVGPLTVQATMKSAAGAGGPPMQRSASAPSIDTGAGGEGEEKQQRRPAPPVLPPRDHGPRGSVMATPDVE